MSRLGERIGVLEALGFSATLTAALAVVVLLLFRRSLGRLRAGAFTSRGGC